MTRERRLVFGEVAELYDRHRPAYPEQLITDLVNLTGVDSQRAVLEVGAGTGKATALFATRGIPVVAVEPSAEMAAVARRNCSAYPGVQIEQSDFENWDAAGRRFPLVFSAQAWHWVQPQAGFANAHSVLSPGGLLAAFWNRPDWEKSDFREVLLAVYREAAPGVTPDGPMHPASTEVDTDDDWVGEVSAAGGFTDTEIRFYEWSHDYSAAEYVGLLATTSEMRLMDEDRMTALLDAVSAVVEAHGNILTLPLSTRLCLARRER